VYEDLNLHFFRSRIFCPDRRASACNIRYNIDLYPSFNEGNGCTYTLCSRKRAGMILKIRHSSKTREVIKNPKIPVSQIVPQKHGGDSRGQCFILFLSVLLSRDVECVCLPRTTPLGRDCGAQAYLFLFLPLVNRTTSHRDRRKVYRFYYEVISLQNYCGYRYSGKLEYCITLLKCMVQANNKLGL
jgi:hypothetical protein